MTANSPPQTRHAIGSPDDRMQALGHPSEDGVAGQVADAVVDRFEVVDVEDDYGELAVVAVSPWHSRTSVSWK